MVLGGVVVQHLLDEPEVVGDDRGSADVVPGHATQQPPGQAEFAAEEGRTRAGETRDLHRCLGWTPWERLSQELLDRVPPSTGPERARQDSNLHPSAWEPFGAERCALCVPSVRGRSVWP